MKKNNQYFPIKDSWWVCITSASLYKYIENTCISSNSLYLQLLPFNAHNFVGCRYMDDLFAK